MTNNIESVVSMLELLETDDILVAVSKVLRGRARNKVYRGNDVVVFEGYMLVDVGYYAPEEPLLELLAFDEQDRRCTGFYEQGRCPKCRAFICSEVKGPNCPICGIFVECT